MTKCRYYPKALCLTGNTEKCHNEYNELNSVCPYYAIYLKGGGKRDDND